MKKIRVLTFGLLSGLLILSTDSLSASAEDYMSKYITKAQRNYLIEGKFIPEYKASFKAMFMAKTEVCYDMGLAAYLASYFIETKASNTLKEINQVEQQLRKQLNILQNNTWEQWGWSAVKYSAIIVATIAIMKASQHYSIKIPSSCKAEVVKTLSDSCGTNAGSLLSYRFHK